MKAILIPLGEGLCFFVDRPKNPSKLVDADGVRFVKKGKEYANLDRAIEVGALSRNKKEEILQQVYEELLCNHSRPSRYASPLSGKVIVRRWLDHSLKPRTIFGNVMACWKVPPSSGAGGVRAEIEYNEPSLSFVREVTSPWTIKPKEKIPEALAWGSRLLFLHEHEPKKTAALPPNTVAEKWFVPDSVDDFPDSHRRILTFKNNIIELERRTSEIGGGAGYGVFCRITPMNRNDKSEAFILPKCEYLDMGIYGPLRCEDEIESTEFLIKSLVFDSKPEAWSFEMSIEDPKSFCDITEETTGDLHDLAKRNVLVYVNETDGKEPATVQALHDPYSHVHYLLGCREKELRIQFGKEEELKIDYGPDYEKVRIQRGYSRLQGETLEKKKADMKEADTFSDMEQWSVDDLEASLNFLDRLNYPTIQATGPKVRALAVSVCLRNSLAKIQHKFESVETIDPTTFCDNGFSKIESEDLTDRINGVIRRILESLCDVSDEGLRRIIVGVHDRRFVPHLAYFLQVSKGQIFAMSGADMRAKLSARSC